MARKLIAGNWKMNGTTSSALALAGDLAARAGSADGLPCELLVCPPAPLLGPVRAALAGGEIALGGQDCHENAAGAHTGDTSAALLADVGCSYVILGHSERRGDHGETSDLVAVKCQRAQECGLKPIVCVGETEAERTAGRALEVIETQLRASLPAGGPAPGLVIAYEPVWAIGTGRTATPDDVAEVHGQIRALLVERFEQSAGAAVRILYGGSVKPGNAAELMSVPDVDGALVGGASLQAEDFWAIASSCP
jgi:triosephosphate isomerase